MATTVPEQSNDYFLDPPGVQVDDDVTAYADDINSLTIKVNTAFGLVEIDIDALGGDFTLAQEWADNDQGDRPQPTLDAYSSKANALEAKDWASASDGDFATGDTINLADGTTTAEPSAKTSADYAEGQATDAETSASNAATSETNAAASATDAASDAADVAEYAAPTVPVDEIFVATSSQTLFTTTGDIYSPGAMVWLNGRKLNITDEYSISGNDITLTLGATTGDILDIHAGGLQATPSSTGLEAIDEGNGNGFRWVGADPLDYDDIGAGAVDFSITDGPTSTLGAYGSQSTCFGRNVRAGDYSICAGHNAEASGISSAAFGNGIASGDYSFAAGLGEASYNYSAIIGEGLLSGDDSQFVCGSYNSSISGAVCIVGIGTASFSRKNGLEVYLDGTIKTPDASIAEIDSRGSKALITKEYLDAEIESVENSTSELVDPPSIATDTGTAGQTSYDSSYFYVCIATDTWKRTAISTW